MESLPSTSRMGQVATWGGNWGMVVARWDPTQTHKGASGRTEYRKVRRSFKIHCQVVSSLVWKVGWMDRKQRVRGSGWKGATREWYTEIR